MIKIIRVKIKINKLEGIKKIKLKGEMKNKKTLTKRKRNQKNEG